jgi:hypothetical protein
MGISVVSFLLAPSCAHVRLSAVGVALCCPLCGLPWQVFITARGDLFLESPKNRKLITDILSRDGKVLELKLYSDKLTLKEYTFATLDSPSAAAQAAGKCHKMTDVDGAEYEMRVKRNHNQRTPHLHPRASTRVPPMEESTRKMVKWSCTVNGRHVDATGKSADPAKNAWCEIGKEAKLVFTFRNTSKFTSFCTSR